MSEAQDQELNPSRVAIAGLCFASFTFGSAVALEDAGASTFVQTQQNVSTCRTNG